MGKVNALTGLPWAAGITAKPHQNYVVTPEQHWIDGFSVGKEAVRQFVAMPLGRGYTVEEQVTGQALFGGLQIQVYPIKRSVFDRRYAPLTHGGLCSSIPLVGHSDVFYSRLPAPDMGIAPGGRIRQQIYEDPNGPEDWDLTQTSRCFVHICNVRQWRAITGQAPPFGPVAPALYEIAKLPWFDYYDETTAVVPGSSLLASLETVADHAQTIGDTPLADNESFEPGHVVRLGSVRKTKEVRDTHW